MNPVVGVYPNQMHVKGGGTHFGVLIFATEIRHSPISELHTPREGTSLPLRSMDTRIARSGKDSGNGSRVGTALAVRQQATRLRVSWRRPAKTFRVAVDALRPSPLRDGN